MAWIEYDQELVDHPKTQKLARELDINPLFAAGILGTLWGWAAKYAKDGSLAKYDDEDIKAALKYWTGDATELVRAMITAEWIDETDDGRVIHDWYDHQGKWTAKKAAEAARKQASRRAAAACNHEEDRGDPKPHEDPKSGKGDTSVRDVSAGHPQDIRRTSAGCPQDVQRYQYQYQYQYQDNNTLSKKDNARARAKEIPLEEICRRWNDTVPDCPKAAGIDEALFRERWEERPDVEWWQALFDRISQSDFLTGSNDRYWRATLGWVLVRENLEKILAGHYDNFQPTLSEEAKASVLNRLSPENAERFQKWTGIRLSSTPKEAMG